MPRVAVYYHHFLFICHSQVTGYVLISNVHTDILNMSGLRVIRGRQLLDIAGDDKYYSLYLDYNYKKDSNNVGLKQLHFTSLHGEQSIYTSTREG